MTPGSLRLLSNRVAALVITLIALATYLSTLLPGVHHFGDVTKAQFLGKFLGMTHPTGYPLYISLTAPLSFLPIGSLAFRVNAFSAVCGAGAVVLLFLLLRDRGVRTVYAALSALVFCFSRMAWEQAVIAEVYSLNVVLFGGVLLCLSRFERTKSPRWFLSGCAVYSMSFGNHLTMVTLLPAFCYGVWWGDREVLKNGRLMGGVLLTVVVGAAQYYYLFQRSGSDSLYLEYRVSNFGEFIDFVSGDHYRRSMFAFEWRAVFVERIPRFAGQLARDLGLFSMLAPLSFGVPNTKNGAALEPIRITLLIALSGQLIWVVGYDIPDIEVYLIPAAWCIAALGGLGLESLTEAWGARVTTLARYFGVACLLPLFFFHQPDHRASAKFARTTQKQLDTLDRDAALINILHYSPRMAYVYFLYAEGRHDTRNLHLSYSAPPKKVAAYLRGKPTLRDSHTHERLPLGLNLYVDSRGAKAERWRDFGLKLSNTRAGLRRVELARD